MPNCPKCGEGLGFLNIKAADETELDDYRKRGYEIPIGICADCARQFKEKIALGEIKPRGKADAVFTPPIPSIEIYTVFPPGITCFENKGFVSSHVSLGTGLLTDFFSFWTDLLGEQSKTYKNKLVEAEIACLNQLKINADNMGADTVIGLQTTYTELTYGKGQILVCMNGTAIKKYS